MVPMSIAPLPLIGYTIAGHIFQRAINPRLPTRNRNQRLGYMTDPEGSQQPSMSLIRSSYGPRASCVAVPTPPANGSARYSRTESRKEHSFVVSSSPKLSAWTLLAGSGPHLHMMAFSRAPMMDSNVAFAQSIIGFGGRTRRMRFVICENSISGWRTGAITGTSFIWWWCSFRRFLISLNLFHSHKRVYSTGEMKSHRCVARQDPAAPAATARTGG